jgi:hypothetical protein
MSNGEDALTSLTLFERLRAHRCHQNDMKKLLRQRFKGFLPEDGS